MTIRKLKWIGSTLVVVGLLIRIHIHGFPHGFLVDHRGRHNLFPIDFEPSIYDFHGVNHEYLPPWRGPYECRVWRISRRPTTVEAVELYCVARNKGVVNLINQTSTQKGATIGVRTALGDLKPNDLLGVDGNPLSGLIYS